MYGFIPSPLFLKFLKPNFFTLSQCLLWKLIFEACEVFHLNSNTCLVYRYFVFICLSIYYLRRLNEVLCFILFLILVWFTTIAVNQQLPVPLLLKRRLKNELVCWGFQILEYLKVYVETFMMLDLLALIDILIFSTHSCLKFVDLVIINI